MLTSWHFGAGGDTLDQKHAFSTKNAKTGITLQYNRDQSVGRYFTWLTSERVLNKICDDIINEKIYL